MGTSVVVLGQVARDLVLVVDRLPGDGSSSDVRERREALGGKGANIAVGLSQLQTPVAVVGVVGDDAVGAALLEQCGRDGLDTRGVIRRSGTESALMVDVVTGDGQWRYFESVPPAALLSAADVGSAAELLQQATTVVLQLQQPSPAVLAALDLVPPGCRVVMDGVPEEGPQRKRLLAKASVLRLDAHEAELLAGHPIEDEAAAREVSRGLLEQGPQLLVLAVGSEGNLLTWTEGEVLIPLLDAGEVVDTTGGGDAFVAALTWALERGEEVERAGRLATAAAGLTVRHPGGRPDLDPSRLQELADRLP